MVHYQALILSLLFSLPAPLTGRLEKAFLQNSPVLLRELMTAQGSIPLSLPDPVAVADQLSPDQAYLVFKRLFSSFKTTEFTADPKVSALPGRRGGILKARWSFRNERTGNMYPLRVYFFLVPERGRPLREGGGAGVTLRIAEIRAERL